MLDLWLGTSDNTRYHSLAGSSRLGDNPTEATEANVTALGEELFKSGQLPDSPSSVPNAESGGLEPT